MPLVHQRHQLHFSSLSLRRFRLSMKKSGGADKNLGLTQRHVAIDQEGSAHDQEGGVAVGLELGPLVRVERVLERKLV